MKFVTTFTLLAAVLLIYPPLDNKSQVKQVKQVNPYTVPVRTSPVVEKAKDRSDSLLKEFLDKAAERDKKINQLIFKAEKLESENALLKRRLKIGAVVKVQSTNAEKKNTLSTVRITVRDTVFVTNTEIIPCPDTLMIPVKRRSLWSRVVPVRRSPDTLAVPVRRRSLWSRIFH